MRYRELVARELKSLKIIQRKQKIFKKRQELIEKWIARSKRPRDKQGRVIKKNIWGDEIVRVRNKWMLRSDVSDS